jgi:hypothetical protein
MSFSDLGELMMVDEITRAAMVALIAQWNLAFYEKAFHDKIRDEADKKAKEFDEIIARCRDACRAFGFDRSDKEKWAEALKQFGPDARQLFNRSRPAHVPPWPSPEDAADSKEEGKEHALSSGPGTEAKGRPTIREIALELLTRAGDNGSKAADIRDYIAKTYSDDLHEKSVGMTLYRLLRDGAVRREGHMWFIVPPKAETVNPGVAAPGSEETAK